MATTSNDVKAHCKYKISQLRTIKQLKKEKEKKEKALQI